jgi:thioredoxin-like negative regulator of GroEL
MMVYTLDPCAPCEIVKDAVKLLEDDVRKSGWKIRIVPAVLADKKSVGAAYLAGVKHFPTVRLVRDGRVVKSFASVREGWTAQDVASFLRSEIETESRTIELVGNEVRVAR